MNTSGGVALFSGTIGPLEIVIVLAVLLLVFGRRIPEVMRSLGKGLTQFKKGLREVEDDVARELDEDKRKALPHEGSGEESSPHDGPDGVENTGSDELKG